MIKAAILLIFSLQHVRTRFPEFILTSSHSFCLTSSPELKDIQCTMAKNGEKQQIFHIFEAENTKMSDIFTRTDEFISRI